MAQFYIDIHSHKFIRRVHSQLYKQCVHPHIFNHNFIPFPHTFSSIMLMFIYKYIYFFTTPSTSTFKILFFSHANDARRHKTPRKFKSEHDCRQTLRIARVFHPTRHFDTSQIILILFIFYISKIIKQFNIIISHILMHKYIN